MASFNTATHRPSPNSPPPPAAPPVDDKSKDRLQKDSYTVSFSCPFNIPSSPESAAVRIVRNLEKFCLYYTVFIWTVLFIALIPARKVSVVYLVATTEVGFLYFLLLRALPNNIVLHQIIDKRFVFFILFIIACVEMIATRAAEHLVIVLAATVPVVFIHAVLNRREDAAGVGEDDEMVRLVQDKLGDGDVPQPEVLV